MVLWTAIRLAIAVLCLVTLDVAFAATSRRLVHESRDRISPSWKKRERASPTTVLVAKIGLAQRGLEGGAEHLFDLSDPESPNYGKHWTPEQIIEEFRPSEKTVASVRQWLQEDGNIEAGRIVHSADKGWFTFKASIDELEKLLFTKFYKYEHTSGHVVYSSEKYYVAEHVRPHIDYVTPGIYLPVHTENHASLFADKSATEALEIRAPTTTKPAPCFKTVTPACIDALYGVPKAESKVNSTNKMGIFADGSYYTQDDLDAYFTTFATQIPNGTHPAVDSIDGGHPRVKQGNQNGGEETLDIEVAYPLIYPQNIRLFQTNDHHYGKVEGYENTTIPDGFNIFLDAISPTYCNYSAYGETGDYPKIDPKYPDPATGKGSYKGKLQCGVYKPTNVISISIAGQEADVPAFYQKRQCNEFMKLGLLGVSVFVASGDTGGRAYPPADGAEGCLGPHNNIFSPMWPSTCPFVTAVGATAITKHGINAPETVAYGYGGTFTSGGGFSNLYPRPSYQKAAVETFFAAHNPSFKGYSRIFNSTAAVRAGKGVAASGGIYNRIGRGIPDVAAIGYRRALVFQGYTANFGSGTSASTPLFAALVNRINEARLACGKGTVGFINPVLYKHPEVLQDVNIGHSNGCGPQNGPFGPGWDAVDGWDPTTGLGTPRFEKMMDLFLSLP